MITIEIYFHFLYIVRHSFKFHSRKEHFQLPGFRANRNNFPYCDRNTPKLTKYPEYLISILYNSILKAVKGQELSKMKNRQIYE